MQTSDSKKCPMCGGVVDVGVKSCGACGEAISAGKTRRARVRLHTELPAVCALCGEASTRRIQLLFRPRDENRGTPIKLPVCDRHRFFRPLAFRQPVRLLVIFSLVILLALGSAKRFAGWPGAIGLGILLTGLLVWAIRKALRIRSPFEDSTHIVLTGVAPGFAQACDEVDDREAADVGDALAQMFHDSCPEQRQS